MKNSGNKFTLTSDRAAAFELLRLQEAAQLANDQLNFASTFTRNKKLSHVVQAIFNFSQFVGNFCTFSLFLVC